MCPAFHALLYEPQSGLLGKSVGGRAAMRSGSSNELTIVM